MAVYSDGTSSSTYASGRRVYAFAASPSADEKEATTDLSLSFQWDRLFARNPRTQKRALAHYLKRCAKTHRCAHGNEHPTQEREITKMGRERKKKKVKQQRKRRRKSETGHMYLPWNIILVEKKKENVQIGKKTKVMPWILLEGDSQ